MDRRKFVAAIPGLPLLPAGRSRPLTWTVTGGTEAPGGVGAIMPDTFGATGDGLADDTASLQAALDAAKTYLDAFGREQARVVIDLHGREHAIAAPLSWPASQGITLFNGTVKADTSFPANRFLIEFQDPGGGQPTQLATFRDVTFDGQRRSGVGCLYLVNHGRTTIDNCFFKRMKAYGVRSVDGTGVSNELMIRGCRFDEWPAGDGPPSAVDSTAISLEHHDSLICDCVIGPARTGINLAGQYNLVTASHIYVGYRPDTTPFSSPKNDGILVTQSHNALVANYLDQCRIRVLNAFHVRITESLFYVDTSQPEDADFAFIDLRLEQPAAPLEGVFIRHNGFHQAQPSPVVAGISNSGPNAWTDALRSCIEDNMLINAVLAPSAVYIPAAIDTRAATPAALSSGNNNDYNPTPPALAETLRLQGASGGSTLTGVAKGWTGRRLRIVNLGGNGITLAHEHGSSTDINRILSPTGANIALPGVNDTAQLEYDGVTRRWRIMSVLT